MPKIQMMIFCEHEPFFDSNDFQIPTESGEKDIHADQIFFHLVKHSIFDTLIC